jgi:hypothetical protein
MQVEARLMESSAADEVGRLDDSEEQVSRAERIIVENLTRDLAIIAIQAQKPGPASTVRQAKQGLLRDDGARIPIKGLPPAAGWSALLAALEWALGQARRMESWNPRLKTRTVDRGDHGRAGEGLPR